jgi:hypothetical protein
LAGSWPASRFQPEYNAILAENGLKGKALLCFSLICCFKGHNILSFLESLCVLDYRRKPYIVILQEVAMIFESQLRRKFWCNFFLWLLVDVVVATITTVVLRQGIFVGVLIFVGLQILSIVKYVFGSVINWIFFYAAGKKQSVNVWLALLHESRFPVPETVEKSTEGYLRRILNSDEYPMSVRLKAAEMVGNYDILNNPNIFGVQACIRLQLAIEEAIRAYQISSLQFPPKAKSC